MKTMICGFAMFVVLCCAVAVQPSFAKDDLRLIANKKDILIPARPAERIALNQAIQDEAISIQKNIAVNGVNDPAAEVIAGGFINQLAPGLDLPSAPKSPDPAVIHIAIGAGKAKEISEQPSLKPGVVLADATDPAKDDTGDKAKNPVDTVYNTTFTGGSTINATFSSIKEFETIAVDQMAAKPNLPTGPKLSPELLRMLGYARQKGLPQAPAFRPGIIGADEDDAAVPPKKTDRADFSVRRLHGSGNGAVLRGAVTIDGLVAE